MKRIICIVLAVVILIPACAVCDDLPQIGRDGLFEFEEAGFISSFEPNDLPEGGICAFEPTELMKEEMASMPQILQDLIHDYMMTEDGELLAYPYDIDILPSGFYVPDAWAASPFSDMTPPTSAEELLDFLEIYLETPHEGFCFIHDELGWWNPHKAVINLMNGWTVQCMYAGEPIIFNHSEFIRLLERTLDLSTRLFAVEKDGKHQKGRQLFQDRCCFGRTDNNLDTVTYANMIPWRITKDQPPLFTVWLRAYCVPGGSPYADRAAELLEMIIPYRETRCAEDHHTLFYMYINPEKANAEEFNNLILKKRGKKNTAGYAAKEFVDSVRDINKYGIPTLYDGMEDMNPESSYTYEQYMGLLKKLMNRKITAADFAAKWDEMNGWAEPAQ